MHTLELFLCFTALQEGLLSTKAPESLVFVTWNIDGLDQTNLKKRTKGVCKILEQEKADVVFLQEVFLNANVIILSFFSFEVIPETFSYIESKMPNYVCLAAKQDNYFVATLLRKGRVYLDHHTVKDFHSSRFNGRGINPIINSSHVYHFSMGRHVLAAQAHCGSVKLDLFNTHLESTKEHAEERGNQLKQCLAQVGSRPSERVSILAGDLNLRDAELVASGGLPERTVDVWEKCGARKEVQYTWDMMRNTNLQVSDWLNTVTYVYSSGKLWQVKAKVQVRPNLPEGLLALHCHRHAIWPDRPAEDHRYPGLPLRPLGLEVPPQFGSGLQ